MNDHSCQTCGADYAPFGFIQRDGDYLFYCRKHESDGKVEMPDPKIQTKFNFDEDLDRVASFKRFLFRGNYDWETKLVAFIRFMVEPRETGTGETWRQKAAPWIGLPPNDHLVDSAVLRAAKQDLIEKTGVTIAPRDRKSNASQKPQWRRTETI